MHPRLPAGAVDATALGRPEARTGADPRLLSGDAGQADPRLLSGDAGQEARHACATHVAAHGTAARRASGIGSPPTAQRP